MTGMHPRAPLAHVPAEARCAADYAVLARDFLPPATLAWLEGGSGRDSSAAANLHAFAEVQIVPRLLRPVQGGHIRCPLAGIERPHPVMLAPLGWQALFHPLAERATAMAAAATGTCFIASTMSSLPLEEIATSAPGERWFQLYIQPDRAATADLLRRAEQAGYGAIMVTLDTPIQLPSHAAVAASFTPPTDRPANLRDYPDPLPVALQPGESRILSGLMRSAPGWDDIDWLLRQTSLPLWVKGVMHPGDARLFVERGVTGIVLSNHGGRSLDGAPASLTMLPAVRAAVGEYFPLLFDGGIRSGTDMFKAIAMGADAIVVGRLQAHALAVAGAVGVGHMIRLLCEELEACMALAGCATLADIRSADLINSGSAWGTGA